MTVKEYFHLADYLDFSSPHFLAVYSFTEARVHSWETQVGSLSGPEKHLCVSRIWLHLVHCISTSCLPPLFSRQSNQKYSMLLIYFCFQEISQIFLVTKHRSTEMLDLTQKLNKIKSANLNTQIEEMKKCSWNLTTSLLL